MSEDIISSLYPPPPPYFKFFTQENINKLDSWKYENDQKNDESEDKADENKDGDDNMEIDNEDKINKNTKNQTGSLDANKLPPGDLKFLVPPKKPDGNHYRCYGNIWSFEDKLPSLKDSGWKQLYEEEDELITSKTKIKELHNLMDSLLLNFLELIGTMSIEPSKFHFKIEDLKIILININHLLNTYRPHQTRESLIMLLRKQIDKKKNEINTIDSVSNDIRQKILRFADKDQLTKLNNGNKLDNDEYNESSEKNEIVKNEIIEKLLKQSNKE